MRVTRTSGLTLAVLFLLTMISACGGGSGDTASGGGGSGGGPSYTGATTQATITESNARTLALAATDGADAGDNEAPLDDLFENVLGNLQSQKSAITAQAAVSGNCGGSATYPDDLSQQQSPISGTISFNAFCLQGESGQMTVSGELSFMAQVENNELISLAMELSDFVITYNGATVTVNATLAYTQMGTSFEFTTDFTNSEGDTLRVENLAVSGSINGVAITSGRVYHPDNGYVDISTTENLVYEGCGNGRPISGILVLQGSGGSSADIVFTSCTTYEVCLNSVCTPYSW